MNPVTVTPATESDLPSIRLLLEELLEAMEDTEGLDLGGSVDNCRAFLGGKDNYVLLAREGDQLAGLINFSLRKTLLHPAPSGLIDEMVVTRNSRGKGIGKLLIRAAVEKCRELGCCEGEVSTEKSNTAARRFYRSAGFEEEAVLLELDLDD